MEKQNVIRKLIALLVIFFAVQNASAANTKTYAALWEAKKSGSKEWTTYATKVVQQYPELIAGTSDIKDFCPNYHSLYADQKANFWVILVSAISKYESNFEPTKRYRESSLGIDDVTGRQVYSEGLLQLSYQDAANYKGCKFDWSTDKRLSATDPKKSILNPYKNLQCGIYILESQVRRRDAIALSSGVYWSVLKRGGRYSKLAEIRALTKQIPYCK